MLNPLIRAILILSALLSQASIGIASVGQKPHIGRILIEGRDICTGFLVSPSIVMTAAHCLQKKNSTTPIGASLISFLIKSPEDGRRRVFSVADVGIRPDFSYISPINPGIPALQSDIALIRLNGIATRSTFEHIGNPTQTSGIAFIPESLASDRSLTGSEECLSRLLNNGLLVLSCDRDKGFSGTPVFAMIDGARKAVGVITARGDRAGVPVLYAVVPHLAISDIVWRKGNAEHQVRLIADR
jgi:protease YdgD